MTTFATRGIQLPADMPSSYVFALEALFRQFGRGIDEAGYRNLPKTLTPTSPDLTLLGKMLEISAGITIPANVFSPGGTEGHIFSVFNNTGSGLTLTQGSGLTLRLGGTTTTGNRTIAAYGVVWCYFPSTTVCVVGGHVT